MKRILLVLALLAVVSPVCADTPRIYESIRPLQTVDEKGELNTICTASSINAQDGYWLTAAHCVLADRGIRKVFIEGERAYLMFVDQWHDMVVLRTEKLRVKALKVRRTAPELMEQAFLAGYPLALSVQIFQGAISSTDTPLADPYGNPRHYMMFAMVACGGNSGGPIVDSKNEIISVMQMGFGGQCSVFAGGALWADVARVVGKFAR